MFTSQRNNLNAARMNEDQEDDNVSLRSGSSRRSMSMCSRSSSIDSSVARREALVKRASATTALEFEQQLLTKRRLMAEKEEELVRLLARERADNEQTMKVLAAQKAAAMADAELAAIDQAILEENEEENRIKNPQSIPHGDPLDDKLHLTNFECGTHFEEPRDRVKGPLKGNFVFEPVQRECSTMKHTSAFPYLLTRVIEENRDEVKSSTTNVIPGDVHGDDARPHIHSGNAHNPRDFAGNEHIYKSIKFNNPPRDQFYHRQQSFDNIFASTIARQNLPKYEPDVFTGDVTFYHTWKGSFQAMLENTNVTAAQEMLYLHNYTRSDPRKLVDSYRRRVYGNPNAALVDIWSALDTKYGNAAAITRSYLASLESAATFAENDRDKIDEFANICVDIDSQMRYLPGLSCLNYVNVLRPIVCKLPRYLIEKWDKIVVKHAEENNNEYPPFNRFSGFMERQAKLKNHPNVLNDVRSTTTRSECVRDNNLEDCTGEDRADLHVYASITEQREPTRNIRQSAEVMYCPLHNASSHDLSQCTLYRRTSMTEKWNIARQEGLCFRCLSPGHSYVYCPAQVECLTCGSNRHGTLFHEESYGDVRTTCTKLAGSHPEFISYSKTLLVDVFPENQPELAQRVYARIDDQSNASMATSELLDSFNCSSPPERFTLSTCDNEKVAKCGRVMCGLTVRSVSGDIDRLPPVFECDYIPGNKNEIPTPKQTRNIPHLRCIADELPHLDERARFMLLIGRDAPELLKVRDFINGPVGAPWAQQLRLGWTVSGRVPSSDIERHPKPCNESKKASYQNNINKSKNSRPITKDTQRNAYKKVESTTEKDINCDIVMDAKCDIVINDKSGIDKRNKSDDSAKCEIAKNVEVVVDEDSKTITSHRKRKKDIEPNRYGITSEAKQSNNEENQEIVEKQNCPTNINRRLRNNKNTSKDENVLFPQMNSTNITKCTEETEIKSNTAIERISRTADVNIHLDGNGIHHSTKICEFSKPRKKAKWRSSGRTV